MISRTRALTCSSRAKTVPSGSRQRRLGRDGDLPLPPLFGPRVFGTAADGIRPAPLGEDQLDISLLPRRCVIRPEGPPGPAAPPAAGLAIEGKGDGIEDRCLARAGVPGNEEDAACPQRFKRELRAAGKGPEGR